MTQIYDVAVIGAGPSGAVASALLNKQGFRVCVIEKQHFPRFVIGESLLPHCIEILEEAGFLSAVQNGFGFQFKNGMAFSWENRYVSFNFSDKSSQGPNFAFQVHRDRFDKILIDEAIAQGVEVRFGEAVHAFNNQGSTATLGIRRENGETYTLEARFVLDASGYYRALPRLLDWDIPSDLPVRHVHFTHIDDHIVHPAFDRNKNLVVIHPEHRDVWIWLIPFSNGLCSIGIVGLPERFADFKGLASSASILKKFSSETPFLNRILTQTQWDNGFPFLYLPGYSVSVKALHGKHFALLGNAAEFLDPMFSSGVTTAVHSAKLAADLLSRHLRGESINWQTDFADRLMIGVNTFRAYVDGWYSERFQDIIFNRELDPESKSMICAILAGYAWDTNNPYVADSQLLFL